MRSVHPCRVDIEVCQGDLVVIILEVIDHLQERVVPVADVIFIQGSDVDILQESQDLLLQGLVHVLVEHVELRLQGELVPDGSLFGAGGVGRDLGSRTWVGRFYEGRGGQGRVHHW